MAWVLPDWTSMFIPFSLVGVFAQDSLHAEQRNTEEHQKEAAEKCDSVPSARSQVRLSSEFFRWGPRLPDFLPSPLIKQHPHFLKICIETLADGAFSWLAYNNFSSDFLYSPPRLYFPLSHFSPPQILNI